MTKTDLIIIGAGPGGYQAAIHAAKNGLSVIIAEASEAGGTCLNCGCIPTKTLCRNAEIIDILKDSELLGLKNCRYDLDFSQIMERKNNVVKQLRDGVESLMQQPGITLIYGLAHFKTSKVVVIGNEEYTADNIIIATGSKSKNPPVEGINLHGVISSSELLNIENVPKHLCIIGAGVIGMEFASIFNSFGCKVTVIEYLKECLPMLDSDIAKRLRQTIAKRGVEFSMQSMVRGIEESQDENGTRQLTVKYEKKGKPQIAEADVVLIATGRKPNIENLNLSGIGISYTDKGIATDENFQTNIPGIYAIGDVNGRCMLAHAATFQGLHAVNQILGKSDNIRFEVMPSAIFTNPEASCVGACEDTLKISGQQYECHKAFYRSNGKALAMNETNGMLKIFIDPSDDNRILGCHAFGAHSSDIVQEIATLINMRATAEQLKDIIHIHPTLSEILHDAVS